MSRKDSSSELKEDDSKISVCSKRSLICVELMEYAKVNDYHSLSSLISSLSCVVDNDFTNDEICAINECLEEEIIGHYADGLKLYCGVPGEKYIQMMVEDLKKKLKILFEMNLENTIDPSLPTKMLRFSEEKEFCNKLFHINLAIMNKTPVGNDCDFPVCMTLACIHWLFIRGVLPCEGTQYSAREKNCCDKLAVFDKKFHFPDAKGVLFHIKNATSHGNIIIRGKNIKIINKKDDNNVLFDGETSIDQLVADYLRCSNDIEDMLSEDMKELYRKTHQSIRNALKNKKFEIDSKILFFGLYYISSYSRDYERIKKFIGDNCKELTDKFDDLYELNLQNKVKPSVIRGGFSHNCSEKDGKIYLGKKGFGIDDWEWLYCSDIMAIIADLILIELELHSRTTLVNFVHEN